MTGQKATVSVLVYGAKGLRPLTGKYKFVVSCEIGSQRYRTDVVEDLFGNPAFNETFHFSVDLPVDDQVLVLIVSEKKEKNVLGQLIAPLIELIQHPFGGDDSEKKSTTPRRVPLGPHKNCSLPTGDIVFEAWIAASTSLMKRPRSLSLATLVEASDESQSPVESTKVGSGHLKRLRERFSFTSSVSDISPGAAAAEGNSSKLPVQSSSLLTSFYPSRRYSLNESLITLKSSRSPCRSASPFSSPADVDHFFPIDSLSLNAADIVHELNNDRGDLYDNDCAVLFRRSPTTGRIAGGNNDDDNTGYQKRWSLEDAAISNNSVNVRQRLPTVSSVSPAHGPTEGGTTVVISGRDLGRSHDDVVVLSICGCDLLSSLQYMSPEKLIVTTDSWRACVGQVVVETASGGRKSDSMLSAAQFTFTDDDFDKPMTSHADGPKTTVTAVTSVEFDDVDANKNTTFDMKNPKVNVRRTGSDRVQKSKVDGSMDVDVPKEKRRHTISTLSASAIVSGFLDVGRRFRRGDVGVERGLTSTLVNDTQHCKSTNIRLENAINYDITTGNDVVPVNQGNADELSRDASRGVRLPQQQPKLPVGEIQPRRKLAIHTDNINGRLTEAPPKKPPRTTAQSNGNSTGVDSEKLLYSTDKELLDVSDLEAQLSDNYNEMLTLSDQNKLLKEQYERLHFYVEGLLVRIFESCPEILSADVHQDRDRICQRAYIK